MACKLRGDFCCLKLRATAITGSTCVMVPGPADYFFFVSAPKEPHAIGKGLLLGCAFWEFRINFLVTGLHSRKLT